MTQITIPAQVVNGHLQHDMSLAELEGKHVIAALTVVPQTRPTCPKVTMPTLEELGGDPNFDPEPPPWLEVEHDVYFPVTVPEKLLVKKALIVERGTPSTIVPEELPDE